MKEKVKKTRFFILIFIFAFLSYLLWFLIRPVKIVAVHKDGHFSSVLVRNFPFTDRGKINWWLKNKEMLKTRYGIPESDPNGDFYITFWIFGEGYKEEGKYDRRCFDDMKTKVNCIEKNAVFSVNNDSRNRIHFTVFDGGDYLLKNSGEVVKYEYK